MHTNWMNIFNQEFNINWAENKWIEKIKDEKTLDGYFGDKWKPVLKNIIEKKFNLPVKTVGFDN